MSVVEGAAAPTAIVAPVPARRAACVAIGSLVVVVLLLGGVLLAQVPSARATQAGYNAATPYRCGRTAPPPGIACWQGVDGRLTQLTIGHNAVGLRQAIATVATADGVLSVAVEPAPALACASPGEPVVARLSGGALTTLFTPQGTLATAANPDVDANVALDGGIVLVATGLLIPCGIGLAAIRRRRRGDAPNVLEAYRPPFMRLAVLAFLAGQAADVATSAIGQSVGLSEGNSLVDVFIRAVGPVGFLIFRLPAIVLVLLGLSQVPRRIAAVALIGMAAIFVSVGAHNAVLAAGAGAAATCGAPGPLP